jgi:maltooligosyltrehalose trehalohydrolase
MALGAITDDRGVMFRVWAPRPRSLELLLQTPEGERRVAMRATGDGYFEARVDGLGAGARYLYLLDGERRRPDPASRSQPEGVHRWSEVVDPRAFPWRHSPRPRPLAEWVIYELHVGTFSQAGSFDAVAAELPRLVDLGVTALELMPVNSFPGARNWGYDGVGWFAPQASYGGPEGLRRLVDAAHGHGLQVIADVVYNHLGPEGNYLGELGPYFTERLHTPWGAALDYRLPEVRAHILANARMFVDEYRVDALRLDAVHAMADDSPRHIVAELAAELRPHVVIAESDSGDAEVIEARGWGCGAQWSDDLHHALHATLTGERSRYYVDFASPSLLARALADGFASTGQFSRYRGRPFGTPAKHLPGERFVVYAQNHDQIGNRANGERLGQLVPGCEHAAAAAYLLAPSLPMIFMGEEHADPAPFLYFTNHGDAALRQAVRDGRRLELGGDAPDPEDPRSFERSRIDLSIGDHSPLRRFYQALLKLRRERPALRALDKQRCDAHSDGPFLWLRRWTEDDELLAAISLSREPCRVELPAPRRGHWAPLIDAADFGGPRGARVIDLERALAVELPPLAVVVWGSAVPQKGK